MRKKTTASRKRSFETVEKVTGDTPEVHVELKEIKEIKEEQAPKYIVSAPDTKLRVGGKHGKIYSTGEIIKEPLNEKTKDFWLLVGAIKRIE